MKERPILFSGEMVRAILSDRKTQTRRVIKPQPMLGKSWRRGQAWWVVDGVQVDLPTSFCPYGILGNRLWVREAWRALDDYNGIGNTSTAAEIEYRIDRVRLWRDIPESKQEEWFHKLTPWVNNPDTPWRPSIHMPRWASRITLQITNVWVERVQDIQEHEVFLEGIDPCLDCDAYIMQHRAGVQHDQTEDFARLWDEINAKRGYAWESNPWTWVVEFHRCTDSRSNQA